MLKDLFSLDNPIMNFISHIADSVILNLLWLLTSLPVFTIGASTTALYYCTLRIAEGKEGGVIKTYFSAFRDNFKQGTLTGLIMLGVGGVLSLDGYVLTRLKNTGVIWVLLYAVWILMVILYVMILIYLFPLEARFVNTIPMMFKNSLIVSVRFLICTIVVAAIHFAVYYFIINIFTPAIFFGEGLCALLSSYLLKNVLHFIEAPEDLTNMKKGKEEP